MTAKQTKRLSEEAASVSPLATMQFVLFLIILLSIAFMIVETCEPDFGTDYRGCDLKQYHNVESWKECSRICSYTTSCLYWTWAHPDSTFMPLTCWLKNRKCRGTPAANFISGDTSCTQTLTHLSKSACHPKYGFDYPGCDMKRIPNVDNWRKCSKLCLFTQGCKQWTWAHRGYRPYPHSCWLKNKICPGKPYSVVISGDVLTYLRCKKIRGQF